MFIEIVPIHKKKEEMMIRNIQAMILLFVFSGEALAADWQVTLNGNIAEIAYGSGGEYPQYGALHLSSSYFRLIPDRDSGWGTSMILSPSYWSGGTYYQGAVVTNLDWATYGDDLVLYVTGQTNGGLGYAGQLTIAPPANGVISAYVDIYPTGIAVIDVKPGEAFKPVMLSSMHVSDTLWDCRMAFAGFSRFPIPVEGWIINPPVSAEIFGLKGGDSQWKANAPTVIFRMQSPRSLQVTGWVTRSGDPNDDNVGLWCTSDTILSEWQYTVVAFTPRIKEHLSDTGGRIYDN